MVRSDLAPADVTTIDGIPVLSVLRTAYDLGRRPPEWRALGHLDDLLKATGLEVRDLWRYIVEHPGMRGIRQIRGLIPHIDTKSESPPESWLRLLIRWHIIRVRAEHYAMNHTRAIDEVLRERGYRG
ncbi:hypothetical protein [Williamsia sp.]|uniref:hypothetical protein n=1 Tax=Williamsia sp. TaxID=1872085 RepID=UPI002F938E50